MGRYVFLGHGGFDPTSGSDVAVVLVPPGTSLKFFSDAGQRLMLPAVGGTGRSDYREVVKVWDHFKEAEKPVPEGGVTYNFSLAPETTDRERSMALLLEWGAEVISLPRGSDDFFMCAGTAATCPTPKLNVVRACNKELAAKGESAVTAFKKWVEGGASAEPPTEIADFVTNRLVDVPKEPADYYEYVAGGVPADRWFHDCDGILGEYAGNELFWVACTGFEVNPADLQELPSLESADATGPGLPNLAGVEPDATRLEKINQLNSKNLQAAASGSGKAALAVGGQVVLIGAGHDSDDADYVRAQADKAEGLLNTKSPFSKDAILVTGIPTGKRQLVESAITAAREELADPGKIPEKAAFE